MDLLIFDVKARGDQWTVSLRDEPGLLTFPTGGAAERQARALATREAVKGLDTEVWIFDRNDRLVGRWVREQFLHALDEAAATLAA
jgi:hypothetical protein